MNKAALKRFALEIRAEVGIGVHGPFDPYLLAATYGVDVHRLSEAHDTTEAQIHFQTQGLRVFSGALIPLNPGAVILDNDRHDDARRRATIAHEMVHVVREHNFATTLVSEKGCRTADHAQEDEATELAAELLLPTDAARALGARQATDAEVADIYGVSVPLARWRMNATGARLIAQRAAMKRM